MSSQEKYESVPTSEIIVNNVDIDEGCEPDITEGVEARGLSTGPPLKNGTQKVMVTTNGNLKCPKDSGFSSRVSEVDGGETDESARRSLVGEHKNLTKRLTRISECQYEEKCVCTPGSVTKVVIKVLGVLCLLYLFICTLDLLSNAFRLLGGKTAGSVFQDSELLANPITGLMIGVLATVILQSSSTSSSIVITMVASKILDLKPAIPIIMGANIGTTVTNTLVSLAHSMNRREFRRAFSGAVIHDVFNWLTVIVLLPLEYCTGYLYHLTGVIISSLNMENMKAKNQDLLKVITKPLTSRIVQVDKNVITAIAQNQKEYMDKPLLKIYCTFEEVEEYSLVNETVTNNVTGEETYNMVNRTVEKKIPLDKCDSLFSILGWNDTSSGIVLFVFSIILLSSCLYFMVKLLHSLLGGQIAKAARKTINADFPRPFHWLTGYVALVVGAGMTILVQSSSVFTSALTPLVGIGCLKLERMYPLTLGSNIGTTFTGILAALASSAATMEVALQLAFCHLFFNISGILLFYPIPRMRKIVINTAKYLGRTTAVYRWFAVAYLICMFLIFPGIFFALSFAGQIPFIISLCIFGAISLFILIVNIMQRYDRLRSCLPLALHTWNFLPEPLRSLAPMDRALKKAIVPCGKCCCQCCLKRCSCLGETEDIDMGYIDSDSETESSVQSSYLPSAASSKMFLSSQSGTDLKSSSSKIYKPASRRNSCTKKSPMVKRNLFSESAITATATPLLGENEKPKEKSTTFYISKSDAHLNKAEKAENDDVKVEGGSGRSSRDEVVIVDMPSVEALRESII